MKVPTMIKKEKVFEAGVLLKQKPSWCVPIFAYFLMFLFFYLSHLFFNWFPPYLYEVFKNLRGLPTSWADWGLLWAHRGLNIVVFLCALHYQFWQLGTLYILTEREIRVESWFPSRKLSSIPFGAIRRYGYQQNWLGFVCHFGTVEIDTAGPTPALLPHCPEPKTFIDTLKPKVEAKLQASHF